MEAQAQAEPRACYYCESVKKAIYKYRQTHADEVKSYSREYYRTKYAENPEYRDYKKRKALERYYAKKAAQQQAQAQAQNAAVPAAQ